MLSDKNKTNIKKMFQYRATTSEFEGKIKFHIIKTDLDSNIARFLIIVD